MKSSTLLVNNLLKIKSRSCRLYMFYDWHIGERECRMDLIKKAIKRLMADKDGYAFLGGDMMDTTIYGSIGNVHDQEFFMNEQRAKLVELLEPISHKILGAISGNHEARMPRSTTFDMMQDVCRELGIDYWGSDKQFGIQINKGGITRIYAHHGIGGGTTEGGAVNSMIKLHWVSPMSDIICSGHSHRIISFPKEIHYLSNTGEEMCKNQWFVCGGTALGRAQYARAKAYSPSPVGQQIIHIHRSRYQNVNYTDIKIEVLLAGADSN